jgi:hypothetical protein
MDEKKFKPEDSGHKIKNSVPAKETVGDAPPETFLKPGMEVIIKGQAKKWKVSGPVHKGFDDKGEGWFIPAEIIIFGRKITNDFRKEEIENWNKE